MIKYLIIVLTFLMLMSCGDNSPFDEDYWDPQEREQAEVENAANGRFVVTLSPTSDLSFTSGSAALDLDGNAAFLRIELNGFSQNLAQAQISVTESPCSTISITPPTTGTLETKNYIYTENGTRAGLFRDAESDTTPEGKYLVVFAFVVGSSGVGNSTSFPYACGQITGPDSTATTPAANETGDVEEGGLGEFSDGGEF